MELWSEVIEEDLRAQDAWRDRKEAARRQREMERRQVAPAPTPRYVTFPELEKVVTVLKGRIVELERESAEQKARIVEQQQHIVGLEQRRFPSYCGLWQPYERYENADIVQCDGSPWICEHPTGMKPGNGDPEVSGWRLFVKRGRDGKNGRDGKDADVPAEPERRVATSRR